MLGPDPFETSALAAEILALVEEARADSTAMLVRNEECLVILREINAMLATHLARRRA